MGTTKTNPTERKKIDTDLLIRQNLGFIRENGYDGIRAELCARFLAAAFPDTHESYKVTWVERFRRGDEWQQMDNNSQRAYLRILCTSWAGTARCINPPLGEKILSLVSGKPEFCGDENCTHHGQPMDIVRIGGVDVPQCKGKKVTE